MRNLEVIALNLDDIKSLNQTSIDRIEFCIDIKNDGLSPTIDMVKEALKISNKKIRVMVREKNSFIISKEQTESEINFIKELSKLESSNLDGVVLGYIKEDGTVNQEYLELVKENKGNLKVTFHKAIDRLIDNNNYLNLKNFEIDTVLTQGGIKEIKNNIKNIEELKKELKGIEILLGGGINKENLDEILKLKTSIHIGSLARKDKDYNKNYDFEFLEELKGRLDE